MTRKNLVVSQVVFNQNDNILELLGLKDVVTGTFLNSATVTVTVIDKAGVNVVGETWPLTMVYVTSSNGDYRATLIDTLTLVEDDVYTAQITANAGVGLQGFWQAPLVVKARNFL